MLKFRGMAIVAVHLKLAQSPWQMPLTARSHKSAENEQLLTAESSAGARPVELSYCDRWFSPSFAFLTLRRSRWNAMDRGIFGGSHRVASISLTVGDLTPA